MISAILLIVMATSVIGMAVCESRDPLSKKFWKEMFRNEK